VNAAGLALALALMLSAIIVTFAAQRARDGLFVQIGAILYVLVAIARSVASLPGSAGHVAADAALALAFLAPSILSLGLLGALGASLPLRLSAAAIGAATVLTIAGAVTQTTALLSAPLIAATVAVVAVSLRQMLRVPVIAAEAIATSLCFLAGAGILLHTHDGADVSFLVFSVAGLLGSAAATARGSVVLVEEKAGLGKTAARVSDRSFRAGR
jgi:hypothetical protein